MTGFATGYLLLAAGYLGAALVRVRSEVKVRACSIRQGHGGTGVARDEEGEVRFEKCCILLHLLHRAVWR